MKIDSLRLRRIARLPSLLIVYTLVLTSSIYLAYGLRFDFDLTKLDIASIGGVCLWTVTIKLVFLYFFFQFSGLLGYFSVPDLRRLFYSIFLSSLAILIVRLSGTGFNVPPRGVILIDFLLSFLSLAFMRLGFRLLRERVLNPQNQSHHRRKRVGIIGAGDVGASLARDLMSKRGLGLQPVVFFDDDPTKWHSRIHELNVVGAPEVILDTKMDLNLEVAIIAMPSAPAKRIGEIVKLLQKAHIKFETVPSLDQLATGKIKVSQLREVEIDDLLGRSPVLLESEIIRRIIVDKVVMVTGAGGSIGSELCRQIAAFHPQRLIILDQSEVQIFIIEQELIELGYGGLILAKVADVLDQARMESIFVRFQPNVIFHAAAHKHVPLMEYQPSEAIKNNSLGTARMCDLALRFKVERFILISTDKAINPTNVMGASKRLAEIYLQALAASSPNGTKFMAVRFGNVLGSSGSVVPVFKKQIAAGGPVKVTHPDVTRYFMTIPEAVGLVLQSGAQGTGGEIFVLDMGEPIKIIDLAKQLIELSGLQLGEDIEIHFTGLRPGEKLFEELSHYGENIAATTHPKIMSFICSPMPIEEARKMFDELLEDIHKMEIGAVKLRLKKSLPEYRPYLT